MSMNDSRPRFSQDEDKLSDMTKDEEGLGSSDQSSDLEDSRSHTPHDISSTLPTQPHPRDAAGEVDVEKDATPATPANGPPKDEKDAFKVDFEEGDKANPRNWSRARKAFMTFQLGMLALSASLGSSIIAPAEPKIAAYLGISEEITVLAVSLYVLGFAFG